MPFLTPGHLPDPGIDPASPALAGGIFTIELMVNGAGTAKQTHAKYNTQSTNNQRKKQKKTFVHQRTRKGLPWRPQNGEETKYFLPHF